MELNIVLDLDETLIHTYENSNILKELYNKGEDKLKKDIIFLSNNLSCIKRPYLDEFISFCFKTFRIVIVWSAGSPEYVKELCEKSFTLYKPYRIYTKDHIKNIGCKRGICDYHKPLIEIFKENPGMNLKNTFIVDDKLTNFIQSNPYNGILIPPYEPNTEKEILSDDRALYMLMLYFSDINVIKSKDVQELKKDITFII